MDAVLVPSMCMVWGEYGGSVLNQISFGHWYNLKSDSSGKRGVSWMSHSCAGAVCPAKSVV